MKTLFFLLLVFAAAFSVYGLRPEMLDSMVAKFRDVKQESRKLEDLYKNVGAAQKFDPEIEEALREMKDEGVMIMNPIVEKLIADKPASGGTSTGYDIKKLFLNFVATIKKISGAIVAVFFALAVIILLLAALTSRSGFSGAGFSLASLGFGLSKKLFFVISLGAVAVWLIIRYNLFSMAGVFLLGPLILLASSALSLKIYDFNTPVWNRMFLSLAWPIASGVAIRVL